jgi:hypothetical protein
MASHSFEVHLAKEALASLTPGQTHWMLGWQNRPTEEWDPELAELWWLFTRSAKIASSAFLGHGAQADGEIAREWWRQIADALKAQFERQRDREYASGLICEENENSEPALTALDLGVLVVIALSLAEGKVPSQVSKAGARGARRRSQRLVRLIEVAAHYVHCVRCGRVADPHPIKSVSDAFGVSRQTVQGWTKRYSIAEGVGIFPVDELLSIMNLAGEEYSLSRRQA